MTSPPEPVEVGTGRLDWYPEERRSDRYGTVGFLDDDLYDYRPLPAAAALVGRYGTLVAHVLETRDSQHIGDLFHGVFPSTPAVGDEITLGTGYVITRDGETVGLQPADGRPAWWLDPRALYRCHSQTVRLVFIPEEQP